MKTINLYRFTELSPEAQATAIKAEVASRQSDSELPWREETIDSFKSIFEKASITLTNWELGAYCYSSASFDMGDAGVLAGKRAFAWLENNLLGALRTPWFGPERWNVARYNYRAGSVQPCPFTGYYADDVLLECLIAKVREGDTLKEAFANLADETRKLLEIEVEGYTCEEAVREDLEDDPNGYYGEVFRASGEKVVS